MSDPWGDEGGYDQWKLDRLEAADEPVCPGPGSMPDPTDDEQF